MNGVLGIAMLKVILDQPLYSGTAIAGLHSIAIISLLLSARAKISYAFALVSLGVFLKLLALKRDKHGLPYIGARILLLTVARLDVGCDRG